MSLVAHNISVSIQQHDILRDVSATFAPGKITVLLGPNGAGKSTLLRTLAGLITPRTGNVSLDDAALLGLPPRQRAQHIGYLPQSADIHWDINVRTLVALGRSAHQGWFGGASAEDIDAIETAMQTTDVARLADRPVLSLSCGERARALLARVLAGRPRWLLADEPLAHLDLAHQYDVLDILAQAAATGCAIIMVLHDLQLAARLADQIVLLSAGRVIAQGSVAETLTSQILSDVYDITAEVVQQTNGRPQIITAPRTNR